MITRGAGLGSLFRARVVFQIHIIQPQWADRNYLCHIVSRFGPMEMWLATRKEDQGSRRKSLQLILIEDFPAAYIEDAGNHGVETVFRMAVRRHPSPRRQPDSDGVGP
ncbi:hypothetical protein X734_23435 [Mesorhizobium sp. L2C084A000]|nr:hypothetical protein X734_23435 [Mesorhizobium sp. L2C084A000]